MLRILHRLDTVPPSDQVHGISLPCAVVMGGVGAVEDSGIVFDVVL